MGERSARAARVEHCRRKKSLLLLFTATGGLSGSRNQKPFQIVPAALLPQAGCGTRRQSQNRAHRLARNTRSQSRTEKPSLSPTSPSTLGFETNGKAPPGRVSAGRQSGAPNSDALPKGAKPRNSSPNLKEKGWLHKLGRQLHGQWESIDPSPKQNSQDRRPRQWLESAPSNRSFEGKAKRVISPPQPFPTP